MTWHGVTKVSFWDINYPPLLLLHSLSLLESHKHAKWLTRLHNPPNHPPPPPLNTNRYFRKYEILHNIQPPPQMTRRIGCSFWFTRNNNNNSTMMAFILSMEEKSTGMGPKWRRNKEMKMEHKGHHVAMWDFSHSIILPSSHHLEGAFNKDSSARRLIANLLELFMKRTKLFKYSGVLSLDQRSGSRRKLNGNLRQCGWERW